MRRVALFVAVLALTGAAAASVGYATRGEASGIAAEPMSHGGGGHDSAAGLASSSGGYTLAPERTTFAVGANDFRFRILGSNGESAHDFDLEGGVRLHLIVVRRDFAGYVHVHPRLQPDGSWRVTLPLAAPGIYRAFTDFEIGGEKTVLGYDLVARGAFTPGALPAASLRTTVGPFTVERSGLAFTVTRAGRPVALQRYLGARGHLVALHVGDLAYTHVHPLEGGPRGRATFEDALESGTYRIFFQFRTGDRVYTAPFTVTK